MFDAAVHAIARLRSVQAEGSKLARTFGAEGAEVAFLRSCRAELSQEQRRFWRAVSRFAWRRHAVNQALDRVFRHMEARRHHRRRA